MQKPLEPEQQVKRLGKYLYKNLDSAYKIEFRPSCCDVMMTLYYQVPGDADTFKEMPILLSIATYQKKIRVNIIEQAEFEKTLGFRTYNSEDLMDLGAAKIMIFGDIISKVEKTYQNYDFVY